jgi:hypothetical protein
MSEYKGISNPRVFWENEINCFHHIIGQALERLYSEHRQQRRYNEELVYNGYNGPSTYGEFSDFIIDQLSLLEKRWLLRYGVPEEAIHETLHVILYRRDALPWNANALMLDRGLLLSPSQMSEMLADIRAIFPELAGGIDKRNRDHFQDRENWYSFDPQTITRESFTLLEEDMRRRSPESPPAGVAKNSDLVRSRFAAEDLAPSTSELSQARSNLKQPESIRIEVRRPPPGVPPPSSERPAGAAAEGPKLIRSVGRRFLLFPRLLHEGTGGEGEVPPVFMPGTGDLPNSIVAEWGAPQSATFLPSAPPLGGDGLTKSTCADFFLEQRQP